MTDGGPDISGNAPWWHHWAPFWERLEDRHLGTLVTEAFVDSIESPVLVIGSGQGVVVDRLRQRGFQVTAVDREPEMAALAKRRRGIRTLLADGRKLPFGDNAFRTVIVATGVVDYLFDEAVIREILSEARRVTRNNGDVIIAFYKLPPRTLKINRGLGVVTPDGRFRLRRIFEIMKGYKEHFLKPQALVREWTGRGALGTFLFWCSLGVVLPRSMRREQKLFLGIFDEAAAAGLDVDALIGSVPAALPYRTEAEVRALLHACGILRYTFDRHPDCTVVRHHKFGGVEGVDLKATAATDDWIIRTRGLRKTYRKRATPAVDDLSLTVERGIVFGILGPNGAGKTTTLSMMCGLLAPTGGTVEMAGMRRRDLRKKLGYVPQDLALYERLTARDNLVFFGRLHGLAGERLRRRIDALLDLTGLAGRADDVVSGFSQGMKRRLNLAAGLLHEPAIVLMDEPTVGIDPQSRNRIHDAIFELRRGGSTILYTTHYMEEATKLCDRIAIMDHGKVILVDTPAGAVAKYGRFRLELTCPAGETGPLLKALRRLPSVESAEAAAGRLHLVANSRVKSTETIHRVEETAQALGAEVALTRLVEPNLESLFLDITGRSLRDAGAA